MLPTDKLRTLKVFVTDRGRYIEVTIAGSITETSELSCRGIKRGKRVVVDVGGIASINSMGIRTWNNFLSELCRVAGVVSIRRLPPNMVSQASMVKNFLVSAEVESYYAPYCCEECGHESIELIPSFADLPDSVPCRQCGDTMHFDDLRESFLAFRSDAEQADTIPADAPLHMLLDPASGDETTSRRPLD